MLDFQERILEIDKADSHRHDDDEDELNILKNRRVKRYAF